MVSVCSDDTLYMWNLQRRIPKLKQKLAFKRERYTCGYGASHWTLEFYITFHIGTLVSTFGVISKIYVFLRSPRPKKIAWQRELRKSSRSEIETNENIFDVTYGGPLLSASLSRVVHTFISCTTFFIILDLLLFPSPILLGCFGYRMLR